ncbi:MAG: hypothetical protein MUC87_09470 [Bacteroidia bacterium]|jgi:peptidoglycan hydrolase CwlO-like protein|nr:hypothetical protein [Bacteroidia bacterium]
MKKAITLAMLLLFATAAQAQKISVKESNENIGGGSHNALVVTIYDAKPDDIEKEWKSKMKGYDAKVSSKKEIFADNALIKEMGGNDPMDVYARVEKVSDTESKFIVGFDLGGAWLNSKDHADKYKIAEKIVRDFALKMTKDAVADIRKAAQKKLDNVKDQQADLEKKNKELKGDIETYKEKIKKAEEDIKTNESDQAKKKTEIEAAQKVLDDIIAREAKID